MSQIASDQNETQKKKVEEEKEPLWVTIADFIVAILETVKELSNLLQLFKWIFQGIRWVFRAMWKVITSLFD
jgi:hypothetical protein